MQKFLNICTIATLFLGFVETSFAEKVLSRRDDNHYITKQIDAGLTEFREKNADLSSDDSFYDYIQFLQTNIKDGSNRLLLEGVLLGIVCDIIECEDTEENQRGIQSLRSTKEAIIKADNESVQNMQDLPVLIFEKMKNDYVSREYVGQIKGEIFAKITAPDRIATINQQIDSSEDLTEDGKNWFKFLAGDKVEYQNTDEAEYHKLFPNTGDKVGSRIQHTLRKAYTNKEKYFYGLGEEFKTNRNLILLFNLYDTINNCGGLVKSGDSKYDYNISIPLSSFREKNGFLKVNAFKMTHAATALWLALGEEYESNEQIYHTALNFTKALYDRKCANPNWKKLDNLTGSEKNSAKFKEHFKIP